MGKFDGIIAFAVIPGVADKWKVTQRFRYTTDAGEVIEVEEGLITDLASTPRIIWNIYPPFGLYTGAAIVHDELYTRQTFERSKCDKILLEAMKAEGVSAITRGIIYSQVALWGWHAWNQHKATNAAAKLATPETVS